MIFQLGWVHCVGIVVASLMAWKGPAATRREMRFWLTAALLAVYLMIAPSQWLWRSVPLLHPVQFPWRFLIVPALGASIGLGALAGLAARWPPLARGATVAALVGCLAVSYGPFATTRPAP